MVLDGLQQLGLQLFLAREGGEDQVVEASVSRREPVVIHRLDHDDEAQIGETTERTSIAACNELYELFLLFFVERVNNFPEPDDGRIFGGGIFVFSASFEFLHIEFIDAADELDDFGTAEELVKRAYLDRSSVA